MNSPLFPTDISLVIPAKPLASNGSTSVYLALAEPVLFLQGYERNEYCERSPTILRGSLILRLAKTDKIRAVTLQFSGEARTEWPEGIPPKRQSHSEVQQVLSHVWPFFDTRFVTAQDLDCGSAPIFRPLNGNSHGTRARPSASVSHTSQGSGSNSNLVDKLRRAASPAPKGRGSLLESLESRARSSSLSSLHSGNSTNSYQNSVSGTCVEDVISKGYLTFQPGDYIYNFEFPIDSSYPETIDATFGSVKYQLDVTVERSGVLKTNIIARQPITLVRTPTESSIQESEPISIMKDWEDQLHYDIVIGGKAFAIGNYIPIAIKLTPLAKVQCHRIRVYLTENMEYYCKNKKVHRMEPAKKHLLMEHKNSDKSSLLGDLDGVEALGSFGVGVTEMEFQVYIPSKLGPYEALKIHPNTTYENIKIHHWIKISLRLSKKDPDNPEKRKHYEVSIDSPLNILSPLCSKAIVGLPVYTPSGYSCGEPHEESELINQSIQQQYLDDFAKAHLESNIYKPPSLSKLQQKTNTKDDDSISLASALSPALSAINLTMGSPLYSGSPYQPPMSPSININVNGSTVAFSSPQLQAQPINLSPMLTTTAIGSPLQRPIHFLRRPSMNPPPFEADIAPPSFEEAERASSIRSGLEGGFSLDSPSSNPHTGSIIPTDNPPAYHDLHFEESDVANELPNFTVDEDEMAHIMSPKTVQSPRSSIDIPISHNLPSTSTRTTVNEGSSNTESSGLRTNSNISPGKQPANSDFLNPGNVTDFNSNMLSHSMNLTINSNSAGKKNRNNDSSPRIAAVNNTQNNEFSSYLDPLNGRENDDNESIYSLSSSRFNQQNDVEGGDRICRITTSNTDRIPLLTANSNFSEVSQIPFLSNDNLNLNNHSADDLNHEGDNRALRNRMESVDITAIYGQPNSTSSFFGSHINRRDRTITGTPGENGITKFWHAVPVGELQYDETVGSLNRGRSVGSSKIIERQIGEEAKRTNSSSTDDGSNVI